MKRIPAFTVLLLMAVVAVVGIASMPLLNVQLAPQPAGRSITVSCSWNNATERIMEAEVTSRLEGVLSGIAGCTSVSSVSDKGTGSVTLDFRKGTDMAAARFEVASRIRNTYDGLPDGVSYPSISLDITGRGARTALTYVIKSSLPSSEIEKFVTGTIFTPVSSVEGVDKVSFWGATPFEIEVIFDSEVADIYGITADQISSAFSTWFRTDMIGLAETGDGVMGLKLSCRRTGNIDDIPVVNREGRIVCLGDIATWRYKESEPVSYFRMNGLNTVMLSVDAVSGSNLLRTVENVKSVMSGLQQTFPEEITATLSYDASSYISSELDKIYFRTFLCVLILLAFVYAVSRSWRYLFIITSTLVVNILVAVVFYNIFHLPVHIYTLAGISVSLGIIIDTSIVMADHYSYYRNRTVFPALLGATATTIGALCVIVLLPEQEKADLGDFSRVIMINLAVSLLTAYLFVPSLIDRFPEHRGHYAVSVRRRRRAVRLSRMYASYIEKGQRYRWAYIVALVAVFGIPLFMLPEKVAENVPEGDRNVFQNAYNAVMSWRPYADNRNMVDKIVGSTFGMFSRALDRSDFYREPGRDILYVHAAMPEGCSVAQLDNVVRSMENYLSMFDEIETFVTRVYSYDNASIEITFRPEVENTSFPAELKARVISMANDFGGATWRVWGVNDSYFNNDVVTSYKSNRIILRGYNYDELSRYADMLIRRLSTNRRVSGPEILSGMWGDLAATEFTLGYDFGQMAAMGVSPYGYYGRLYSVLYDTRLGNIPVDGHYVPVVMRSSERDRFDIWHVLNSQVAVDSVKVKLSEIGSIVKKRTGLPIRRSNQSYEIIVGFDFIGSYELSKRLTESVVKYFNDEVLPVGYKAETPMYGYWGEAGKMRYAGLILLVIAVIYIMCSITFESLRLPLAVILMIPVSFIGVFLVFGLSDFSFDKGGFAAFVMLSGIVVNAGIYIVNSFQNDRSRRPAVVKYVKAFNHKITAIMLTVLSTILGLVPFLFDGPDEVFWFPFAIGTIGGIIFSVIAMLLYLPVFCFGKKDSV